MECRNIIVKMYQQFRLFVLNVTEKQKQHFKLAKQNNALRTVSFPSYFFQL